MIEHSIKLMYIGVSALLLVIALTSFYSHEKKFMQFFTLQGEARRQSSWLKEAGNEGDSRLEVFKLSKVHDFQKTTEYTSYVFTGKEIKEQVYGTLLYQGKELNQDQGIRLPSSLNQLLTSEEILEIELIVICDGVVVSQYNAQTLIAGIDDTGLYGLRYTIDENKVEILPIH